MNLKMLPSPVMTCIVYCCPLVKVNPTPWRMHCEQLEAMLNVDVAAPFGAIDGPLQFAREYSFPLESVIV